MCFINSSFWLVLIDKSLFRFDWFFQSISCRTQTTSINDMRPSSSFLSFHSSFGHFFSKTLLLSLSLSSFFFLKRCLELSFLFKQSQHIFVCFGILPVDNLHIAPYPHFKNFQSVSILLSQWPSFRPPYNSALQTVVFVSFFLRSWLKFHIYLDLCRLLYYLFIFRYVDFIASFAIASIPAKSHDFI